MLLKNKNILLGVTGGIAAYKAAILVRLLKKQGANVRVIMSRSAKDFITPLTMATLSQNPILVENFDPENGAWNSHISLGEWADLYIVAPATANTLAKMAGGIADNLLLCTYLSARCPVWVAPAMDFDMYLHRTTQQNIEKLSSLGVLVIEPGEGFLASGLVGKGRMCEPEEISARVEQWALDNGPRLTGNFVGKKVLITAGGTVENIDPVRFISNYSTGKMGYAIADRLYEMGAEVTLVSGAATAKLRHNDGIKTISALSAQNMYEAVEKEFKDSDITIFCAAVADYTPSHPETQKIKHEKLPIMTLELKATTDIAAQMGIIKRKGQLTIGFALETNNEFKNAKQKLETKNLDAIILNSLAVSGAGFGTSTNQVNIITQNRAVEYPLKDKHDVANDIAQWLAEHIKSI